jgi:hypothetical protein
MSIEEVLEFLKIKMNSTPDSYKESAVKLYAHEVYEFIRGKTLSDELRDMMKE